MMCADHARYRSSVPPHHSLYPTGLLAALGVTTMVAGLRTEQFGIVNVGMAILALLILVRFFGSELDFVVRGLAFVAVGVGFLVTNLLLVKRMKVAQ
jgi:uncharacterized membrane protein